MDSKIIKSYQCSLEKSHDVSIAGLPAHFSQIIRNLGPFFCQKLRKNRMNLGKNLGKLGKYWHLFTLICQCDLTALSYITKIKYLTLL